MLATSDLSNLGYDTVIVAGVDVQGQLFGRRVPLRRFLEDPELEIPACTCALAWDITQSLGAPVPFAGWHTGWNDFLLRPDLRTLRPYPGSPGTAICLADLVDEESGDPLPIAPRTILRRQVERARNLGYEVLLASELEFYLFHGGVSEARRSKFRELQPTTLVRSDYSIVGQSVQEPFIGRIRREMEAAGIPIHACQAEFGLGQWEVNLEHCDALEMADRHVIYKAGVKEMARRDGLSVTFMAMPVAGDFGSSSHFHCSLRRDGEPVLPAEAGSRRLSPAGVSFVGGLIEHLDETAVLLAPYVNSYKRLQGEVLRIGIKAWGYDNRTVTFRVVGRGASLRVEHRYPGADVNPYLGAAAILASGLDGIERGIDPGPPVTGSAYERPDLGRAPLSLGETISVFERSAFAAATFGDGVVNHYAVHARNEWASYLRAVTDWEVLRAFELA